MFALNCPALKSTLPDDVIVDALPLRTPRVPIVMSVAERALLDAERSKLNVSPASLLVIPKLEPSDAALVRVQVRLAAAPAKRVITIGAVTVPKDAVSDT